MERAEIVSDPAADISAELRRRLGGAGFDVVRFAAIGGAAPGADALKRWIDEGYHAEMAWMPRSLEKRLAPELVLPGARSVVLLGVNYGAGHGDSRPSPKGALGAIAGAPVVGPDGKGAQSGSSLEGVDSVVWARYACYEDYHDTIKPGLVRAGRELECTLGIGPADYRYYVDTGPVLERGWAARAGLGFIGKNGMLISPLFGNWLFLCAILVRAELPSDPPFGTGRLGAGCGRCTRCLDACPTQAFVAPGVVDARRCISYLTIEHKGSIPEAFREAIGDRIYGCDVCADVCPWNRFAQEARSLLLVQRRAFEQLSLDEILSLTPERFAEVFRGTPIKRLKLERLLRNACIAAGNVRSPTLRAPLERLLVHPSPLVREHAAWALARLLT